MQTKEQLISQIKETIREMQTELSVDKVHLGLLGNCLNAKNIDWRSSPNQKLKFLLAEFSNIFQIEMVKNETNNNAPPAAYVRLISPDTNMNKDTVTRVPSAEPAVGEPPANVPSMTPSAETSAKILPASASAVTEAATAPLGNEKIPKPRFAADKSALYALGFVENLEYAFVVLNKMTDQDINKTELENNMRASYDANDIVYYEYKADGTLRKSDSFSEEKTVVFAVNTKLQTKRSAEPIYAQYNKTHLGWKGVFFNTLSVMTSKLDVKLNSYHIGLLEFNNFAEADAFITDLHQLLMPGEVWRNSEPNDDPRPKVKYNILASYLGTVLSALMEKTNIADEKNSNYNKIRFSGDGTRVLFNTGLLSKYTQDIRIVGEVKKQEPSQPFHIVNPRIITKGEKQITKLGFDKNDAKVEMYNFYSTPSEIIFNATKDIYLDDIEALEHCIEDGLSRNRFSKAFMEEYEGKDISVIADAFISAIKKAHKIAKRDYKYIVPQYYEKKIQFLMPIYMTSSYDGIPDSVLILDDSEPDDGNYTPKTMLKVSWAYGNARVLCRPSASWLLPSIDTENSTSDK
ncbi:MAG: DUF3825 domain-containing protein [Selenomonadales bacterium]|nr:DUF3825 domain-containing protein [Selenomonadales bacterium]